MGKWTIIWCDGKISNNMRDGKLAILWHEVIDYNDVIGKQAIMQHDDNGKLARRDGKMGNSNT